MRRFSVVVLVGLFAALIPLWPVQALDEPECVLEVPAEVVVTAPITPIWPKFPNCEGRTTSWDVYGYPPGAVAKLGSFGLTDGVSDGAFRFLDRYPVGRLKTFNPDANANPTFVVKFGSRISLKGERVSDLKVPLRGVASRYVPSVNEFRRWANRPVAISYKDCVDCPWQFLAMDKTDQYGVFSLGAVSYEARYYRAKVGETTTTWDRTSTPVYF